LELGDPLLARYPRELEDARLSRFEREGEDFRRLNASPAL
jgi:hypothetical protein